MVLARIMPDGVVDVRSFECPKCYRVLIERVPTDPMEQSKNPRAGYRVSLNRRDKDTASCSALSVTVQAHATDIGDLGACHHRPLWHAGRSNDLAGKMQIYACLTSAWPKQAFITSDPRRKSASTR